MRECFTTMTSMEFEGIDSGATENCFLMESGSRDYER